MREKHCTADWNLLHDTASAVTAAAARICGASIPTGAAAGSTAVQSDAAVVFVLAVCYPGAIGPAGMVV